MKVFATLSLAALLLCSPTNGKHHHHEEHRNSSVLSRSLLSNTCDFICGSSGAPTGLAVPSWQIDLTEQSQIGVIIVFEGNSQSLAFINPSKKTVIVLTGNKNIFGIFNIEANAGLIVNANNGVAKYVTISSMSNLFFSANVDYFSGVYALANTIFAHQSSITGVLTFLLLNSSTFNFRSFITSLSTGSVSLYGFFTGKTALFNNFQASFGTIFASITTNIQYAAGFKFEFGVFNSLIAVLGNVSGVSYGFLLIIQKFAVSSEGFASGSVLYQLFTQVSLYAEAFRVGKITSVSLSADLQLNFFVGASVIFAVTINGLILVGGAIRGTIDAALSIVGNIIGSAYIGIGVHFEAGIRSQISIA